MVLDGHQEFTIRELFASKHESRYVLLVSTIAALNSALLGYDVSIMSAALVFIRREFQMDDVCEELVSGILNAAAILGALLGGLSMNAHGRKHVIALACAFAGIGSVLSGAAMGIKSLLLARAILGLGIGSVVMAVPVYIAEVVPLRMRGCLVSLTEVAISVGVFIGFFAGWSIGLTSMTWKWRLMVGVGALPALLNLMLLQALPESPRWMMMRFGPKLAEERFAESGAPAELIREILGSKAQQEELDDAAGWREMLRPTPGLRLSLLVGLGIAVQQQMSGIEAVMYYTPMMLQRAGVRSENAQLFLMLGMGLTKLVATLWSGAIIDRVGRRPLLVGGSVGIALCYLVMSASYLSGWLLACVGSFHAFVACYAMSLGPVAWVTISEVFPTRIRAQCVAMAVAINRATSAACVLCFLSLADVMTPAGLFFLLSIGSTGAAVFFYALLPETRGRSLEEVEQQFAALALCAARREAGEV